MKAILIFIVMLGLSACCNSKSTTKDKNLDTKHTAMTQEERREDSTTNGVDQQLYDIWVLETMADKSAKDLFKNELPRLEIYLDKNRISGFGGCNTYFTTIKEIDYKTFVLNDIAATKMYCENIPENAYLELLANVDSYKREGLTLKLSKGDIVLLTFRKVD